MGASAKLEGCFFFSQRREGTMGASAEFEGCLFSRKDFSQRRKGAKGASAKFEGCFFLAEAQVLRFKRGVSAKDCYAIIIPLVYLILGKVNFGKSEFMG
jgi:hypothetical protein